jgi:AbiJ N-terminal domain 4
MSTEVVQRIARNVLSVAIEEIERRHPRQWLYQQVQGMPWHTVYDLLEFMADGVEEFTYGGVNSNAFQTHSNDLLKLENAGYRFVAGKLTEVTSPADIESIERALRDAESHGFSAVHTHIKQALDLLGKRPEPDYRNAIKEAISAVESAANLIQTGKKRTLDPVLDLLEKRLKLHRAFKDALSKLYGFTSDDSGIRHALMYEPTVDDADTRFFIVACSAFVSWLIVKADQAGLIKPGR